MFADIADDKGKGRLHQQIDENLKRVYEEALTEEIPDRFKKLIDRLRSRESEE
jgi:hemerythrin-like domain-containing protein